MSNHAVCLRPEDDPLLDTMDKERRLGLHTLRVHGPSGLRNRAEDGVLVASEVW